LTKANQSWPLLEEVRALLKRIQQADRLAVSREVELEIFGDDAS
jgi:hypothetical protein